MISRPGTWTVPLRVAAGSPTGRVVAIPYAGAGPHALMPLLGGLPPTLDVVGVALPGRGHRWTESVRTLAADPLAVADAIAAELAMLPPLLTVLFGHSLGAGIAAAVAAARPGLVDGVVLSAYPGHGNPAQRAGRWTDDELLDILRSGTDDVDRLESSPTWRRSVLDRLRPELTLAVRLAYLLRPGELRVPLTVLAGDADRIAAPVDLDGWRGVLASGSRTRTFAGGHFYLFDDRHLADVTAEIARMLRGGEMAIAS